MAGLPDSNIEDKLVQRTAENSELLDRIYGKLGIGTEPARTTDHLNGGAKGTDAGKSGESAVESKKPVEHLRPSPWGKPNSSLPQVEISPGKRETDKEQEKKPKPAEKLPPFVINDSTKKQNQTVGDPIPKVYELNRLDNRAADHTTPDAVVRIPAHFDPSKPINIVIYNHGWGSTVRSAFKDNGLSAQMDNAPPNSVLILPEWQRTAGASNGDQGRFSDPNRFRNMLQEIFNKTPELSGKTLKDVAGISIFAHSAGYGPTETIINKNGLSHKVTSIILLDALYNNQGFDKWIEDNIGDLAAGNKQFYNFYNGTSRYSTQQAARVRQMLKDAQLPASVMLDDHSNGNRLMDAETLAKYPIAFKYSTLKEGQHTPHFAIPMQYVGPVQKAAEKRARQK